jgi:hypothetical protein
MKKNMNTKGATLTTRTPIPCTLVDFLAGSGREGKCGGLKLASSNISIPPTFTITNKRCIHGSGDSRVSNIAYGSMIDNAVHRIGMNAATAYV